MEEQLFDGKVYHLYPKERYFSRGNKRMHRVVWEFHNGAIPQGFHVHHIDHNPRNNDIGNLSLIKSFDHLSGHMTPSRRAQNKELIDRIRPLTKVWHASEEGRKWHSIHGMASWKGRKLHERNCNQCSSLYKTPFPSRSKFCHQNCKAMAQRRRMA